MRLYPQSSSKCKNYPYKFLCTLKPQSPKKLIHFRLTLKIIHGGEFPYALDPRFSNHQAVEATFSLAAALRTQHVETLDRLHC